MKLKITLYTNCFMHNGEKVMSVSLLIWRSGSDVTSVGVPGYVRGNGGLFEKSMDARALALSICTMLTDCGHEVEVDAALKSSMAADAVLVEAYGRDLQNAG